MLGCYAFTLSILTVMEENVETINANDTETYLLIIESEEYWNISRVIFDTLIIFVIFSSLSLVMVHHIKFLGEGVKWRNIQKHIWELSSGNPDGMSLEEIGFRSS